MTSLPVDIPSANIMVHFAEAFDVMESHVSCNKRVLVCCTMGVSRSATIVIAFLMKCHGWSMTQAIEYIASKRPQISPNLGFIKQLQSLEESLHPSPTFKEMMK